VCGHVPEKHGLVAADTDEAIVVLRNAQVMHFVAMGAVFLYFEAGGWVEEADLSVGATGQELWWWRLGVCFGRVVVVEVGPYVLA
jgi:hypothetical protein